MSFSTTLVYYVSNLTNGGWGLAWRPIPILLTMHLAFASPATHCPTQNWWNNIYWEQFSWLKNWKEISKISNFTFMQTVKMGGGRRTGLHIAIVNNDKLSQTYKNSHFFKRTLKKKKKQRAPFTRKSIRAKTILFSTFSTKNKQNWSKFKTFKYPNITINQHVQHVDSLFTASIQHSHNKCSGDTRIQCELYTYL